MTTYRGGGQSRPASSRATSGSRTTLKKRDKPYTTKKGKVLAKKRPIDFHTSYNPQLKGFTFVAFGTPDLAKRCKELSRQRGFPVHIVHARPINKESRDPKKVSHHIHRIGYHFKSEIVSEVVNELDYQLVRGQFVKSADLEKQMNQSRIAKIMAGRGLTWQQASEQETPEKVGAVIRELFPKIPELDLNDIVTRAWERGSQRVGTNSDMDLSQRVQLATLARIRHTYTDYDYLLRAFGSWERARADVEPDSLRKVIEWRGEQDAGDNELEEIWRDIIIIDDDYGDDKPQAANGDEADDEDSAAETGDISDSSVEITHTVAADEDLVAESMDESSRTPAHRFQPAASWQQKQADAAERARRGIGVARQQLHNAVPPQHPYDRASSFQGARAYNDRHPTSVHVPSGPNGAPEKIEINGKWYLRNHIPVASTPSQPSPILQYHLRPANTYGTPLRQEVVPPISESSPYLVKPTHLAAFDDRPIPSIERDDPYTPSRPAPQFATYQRAPNRRAVTPEGEQNKRRRIEHPTNEPPIGHRPLLSYEGAPAHGPRPSGNYVDLTGAEQGPQRARPSPPNEVLASSLNYDQNAHRNLAEHPNRGIMQHGQWPPFPEIPPPPLAELSRPPSGRSNPFPPQEHQTSEYDPTKPLLQQPRDDHKGVRVVQVKPQPANSCYSYPSQTQPIPYQGAHYPAPGPLSHAPAPTEQPIYRLPGPYFVHAPQPVHGAPAPVQQLPRHARSMGGASSMMASHYGLVRQPTVPPAPPPTDGAPHPAQLYQQR